MRTFFKQLVLFLGISGILLIMAGCGVKGGGGGLDDAKIKQAIDARVNSFKTAVEAYDVEGMLDFLEKTSSAEQLTIAEGKKLDHKYPKTYETLKSELEQDERKQQYWRKPPLEGGNGYTLNMELESITYNKLSAGGADAVVSFTIIEAAQEPSINPETTDKGHMTCAMVKLQGTWRCHKMTIVFYGPDEISASSVLNSVSVASYQAASQTGNNKTKGFCFGRFDFDKSE